MGCLSYLALPKIWDVPSWRQMGWGPLHHILEVWPSVVSAGLRFPLALLTVSGAKPLPSLPNLALGRGWVVSYWGGGVVLPKVAVG